MKILFDFKDMVGGAPRSHLAHMNLLYKAGCDVVATIGDDLEELQKLTDGVRIIPVTNFRHLNGFKLFENIRKWVKLIKTEKPDIIYSNRIPQFKFLAILSDLTGIPLVFAQAGGKACKQNLLTMKGKTPVAYSIENKKVFVSAGFSEKNIHVISNRILQPDINLSPSDSSEKGLLNILMVGNIKSVTINGYLHFIKFLSDNLSDVKNPFRIKIAGKDISPGNIYMQTISDKISATNNALKEVGKIENPAWLDNIQVAQAQSDVVIGKGRSVIEPAMQGKVCFVLAETGRLTRISPVNFQSLYEYNFSGRGNQSDNGSDFLGLLSEGINDTFLKEAHEVAQFVKQAYLLEYAKEKLENAFAAALNNKKSNWSIRIYNAFKRFAWIYKFLIINKLKKLTA